jgi:CheY-like chemotaxis protein
MKKFNSILLIEDDPISNFISDSIIRRLNITDEIVIKGDGESALEFLEDCYLNKKSLPQLILLDINMPVMDGFEFLEKLDSLSYYNKYETILVVLSNILAERDVQILNHITELKYLCKPLNKEKLMEVLLKVRKPEFQFHQ